MKEQDHTFAKEEPKNGTYRMPERPTKKSFTIHDLPVSERPRERLLKFGPEALSAQEILALVLGRGITGKSVLVTAQRLLSEFSNFKGVANASIEELSKVKGIGLAKAAQFQASFELAKRVEESYLYEKKREKLSQIPKMP